jgi:hypothetical protein
MFIYLGWSRFNWAIIFNPQKTAKSRIFLCSILSGAPSISCEFICIHFKDLCEECRKVTGRRSFSVCQFMPREPFFAFATVVGMQCFIVMHFYRVAVWTTLYQAFFFGHYNHTLVILRFSHIFYIHRYFVFFVQLSMF